jgi:hypothetical protein
MSLKVDIYKLSSKDPNIKYFHIGSTKNIYKTRHLFKRNMQIKRNNFIYSIVSMNGGWDNWEIILLEKCDSISKAELEEKIEKWKKLYNFTEMHRSLTEPHQNCTEPHRTSPTLTEKPKNNNKNPLQCKACFKTFSNNFCLKRHMQGRCKAEDSHESLKECLAEQQEIIQRLEKELHEKDKQLVSVTNNNNTTNNTNSHNTVNTVINNNTNHIKLVGLGNENILELLSDQEKKQIMGKMHKSLLHLIEKVHFSGEYPQFANVVITNLKNKLAYKYSEADQKFIVDAAEKVITEVIDNHFEDICSIYEEQKDSLDTKINIRTGEFIEQHTNNPDKYKQTTNDVRFMMYNKREKVDINTNTQKTIKNT